MKAKILRCIDAKSMHKDPTCVLCGERGRRNKSLFEAELPCRYKAEVRICRQCSGEEGAMRRDSFIELPYVEAHYHVRADLNRTFWEFRDTLNWIKEYMQAPPAIEKEPGVHIISIPRKDVEFFRCEGKPLPPSETL